MEVLASVLLCLTALIIALFLHPVFESNDDAIIESLLFGYHGMNGTSFLVYQNRFLGCILHFLVSVIPYVNWYFILQYSVCISALFVLTRAFIHKFRLNGLFAGILIVAAGMETLYSVQYTQTAALAAVAGFIGLMVFLREKNNLFFICICVWLIVTASMIRKESFLMVCPFLGIIGLYELAEKLKSEKENIRRYVVTLGITIVLLITCYALGKIIDRNTPGARDFYSYNSYRTSLTDFPIDYSTGSDVDLLMVSIWMNNDPEVLTVERMKELNDLHRSEKSFTIDSLTRLFSDYFPEVIRTEPMLIIALAEMVFFLIFSKRRLFVFPLIGSYVFLEWYLSCIGRIGFHRVDFGILFTLIVSLMYLSDISMSEFKEDIKTIVHYVVVPVAVLAGVFIVCNFNFIWHASVLEYRKGESGSLKMVTADPEYKYMVHPILLGLDRDRNLYELPTNQFREDYFIMGGWQEGIAIPGHELPNHDSIEGNPWNACVDNNSIKLVLPRANGESAMKVAALYIWKHYGKKCSGVLDYQDDFVLVCHMISAE